MTHQKKANHTENTRLCVMCIKTTARQGNASNKGEHCEQHRGKNKTKHTKFALLKANCHMKITFFSLSPSVALPFCRLCSFAVSAFAENVQERKKSAEE